MADGEEGDYALKVVLGDVDWESDVLDEIVWSSDVLGLQRNSLAESLTNSSPEMTG